MGLIFFFYLLLIFIVIRKNMVLKFILKLKFRFPVSVKEKYILKHYYGIVGLAVNIERYQDSVFHDVLIIIPLVWIGMTLDSGFVFLALSILLGASRFRYIQLRNIVNSRRVEFFKEYPGFLNSLMLYLEAGLTLENALSKYYVAAHYGYYLSLIRTSLDKINLGFNRKEAFQEIILGTRERELIKLVNFFIQFYLIGSSSNGYLIRLAEDAWKLKKETIKQLAEEGSAKMVIPMMIIFIGVGLLVLVPSVFSIMNSNVF
jgi:tight adherence protein C